MGKLDSLQPLASSCLLDCDSFNNRRGEAQPLNLLTPMHMQQASSP